LFLGAGIAAKVGRKVGSRVICPHQGSWRDCALKRRPHELIEDLVERTADAPAPILDPEQISYRELNSCANRLAHFLCEQGVGLESRVGVCRDRSFELGLSLLAILKSNGTYLSLDPKFPKHGLAFMLAGSEVSVFLTDSSNRETLPETTARVVLLERITSADHISLGLPIANTQFHVLDENHKPVSLGISKHCRGLTNPKSRQPASSAGGLFHGKVLPVC